MYLLVLLIPLLIFLTMLFFGYKIGIEGFLKLLLNYLILLLIICLIIFYETFICKNILYLKNIIYLNLDICRIQINWLFDSLSSSLLLTVIIISFIVILYSYEYMFKDAHIIRFLNIIVLFIFSMILLLISSNLFILFIGWELVGLSSFLLISYYYTRLESNLGGILALIMNRFGDIFYISGLFLCLYLFLSYEWIIIQSILNVINVDLLLFCLIIASMSKSAQLFLHYWLPYSMEGPTPISALIHAATMVTAGVFLLLRLSNLLSFSYYSIIFIIIIGSLTTFFGGLFCLSSVDIKELVAYSTMSQLGYMVTILGLKYFNLSFYHLLSHAYFKALLFLTAGCLIHSVADIQDFRKLGSLIYLLPITYIIFLIAFQSLMGVPFTTGFYSKESLINSTFTNIHLQFNFLYHYCYLFTLITALLTTIYSIQFILKVYIHTTNLSFFIHKKLHYSNKLLLISLILLTLLTIFLGYFFHKFIYFYDTYFSYFDLNIPTFIKNIPSLFIILFIIIYTIYNSYYNIEITSIINTLYFKDFYKFITTFFYKLSYRIFYKILDYGFFDLISHLGGSKENTKYRIHFDIITLIILTLLAGFFG